MFSLSVWKKAWALLSRQERRNAWIVLTVVVLAAFSSAAMIGSIMPFLSVLAEPQRIHEVSALAWAYQVGGFTSDYSFLVALGLGSLAVILAANLMQIVRAGVVLRYTTMRMHTLSRRLLTSYLRQPYEFFLNQHSGVMSTQILSEAQQVVAQFFRPAADVIASSLTVLVIVALLLWVNPVVAVLAFVLIGGIYGGTFLLTRRVIARQGRSRVRMNKARFRIASEALTGVKDIKLLAKEHAYILRFATASRRWAVTQVIVGLVGQIPQYVMQSVAFGGMLILCMVLVDPQGLESGRVLGDILPILGVFAFAGQRLIPELSKVYRGLTLIQYGAAAVDSIHKDLLQGAGTVSLPETPPEALGLNRELRLDRVGYRYPNADQSGLRGVSLVIRAGEKIGVVGSSGAGKTTFADLVLGLLRPTEGDIIVDGVPITEGNLRAWQQGVGYVPQDIFLTDSSVAENIALGVAPEEIDQVRVETAARIAQLDDFIRAELPDGYDTKIGERGVRLSGGQRQRMGIARAMYHEADFVVFDEATSALDNPTEREVMAAIDNLPGDKTVLIIAHRLTTVQRCDRILILDQGRVAGFDRWDALSATNREFREIAEIE